MLGILTSSSDALNVTTPAAELENAVEQTREHLSTSSANTEIQSIMLSGTDLSFDVVVRNLAGHKLPTAYPSRRVWLHVKVADDKGATLFESGAPRKDGSIVGNDNDMVLSIYEPHFDEITEAGQVQIYEPIVFD